MTGIRKSWRDTLPIHPACELFPLMSEAELRELGEDIKRKGLWNEIVLFKKEIGPNEFEFSLLGGRNRLDAMELVGIDFKIKHTKGGRAHAYDVWQIQIPDDIPNPLGSSNPLRYVDSRYVDPYQASFSDNFHRRHLTPEGKRDAIEKLIKATPERSDREIAKMAKVGKNVINRTRKKLEATGTVGPVEKRVGADGKSRKQPAKRAKRTPDDFAADVKAKQPNQPKSAGSSQPEAAKPDVKSASKLWSRSSAAYLLTEMIAHGIKSDPTKTAQHMREVLSVATIDKLVGWLDQFLIEIKKNPTAPRNSVVMETMH